MMPEQTKTMHNPIHHDDSTVTLGFWIYLMTDLIMFAVFFAAYAVLHNNTFGGPSGKELFNMPFVLVETVILLTSSYTCGLGMLAVHRKSKSQTLLWFAVTFLLGLSFLAMELYEFNNLIAEGHTPQKSAFLSSFFTLVGAHGLHIFSGLLWLGILLVYVVFRGLNESATRKLALLSLFWHFLDIVWIFIFTVVYLLGTRL
jgi:cytochrome o ubiquinol oxidase subunit 3